MAPTALELARAEGVSLQKHLGYSPQICRDLESGLRDLALAARLGLA